MARFPLPADLALPRSLDEIDAADMTKVLRHGGAISAKNEVVERAEQGVGMTAGYFPSIKIAADRFDEVMRLIRDVVDVAVAWEGADAARRPTNSKRAACGSGQSRRTSAPSKPACAGRPRSWT
jgi:hypothetical protein